ncbi:glutathione S-transferase family protein [Pelomonas sp. KK5]|uniref:glutathione S-transferase family protein n=1 Tax=Pelomonas sp. KK5 TaxID=1855730 RepID=UPI00097C3730|nr:glutathione S-transferase family protein [Pelomonas sp. KK5]
MLTVHHLSTSQSERVVWLCEELGLAYTLKRYERDPVTRLAPPELKALHPMGGAPLIEEDGLLLAESGAIVDYLMARHGGGRLALAPDHPDYANYLYWFHFANGNLQPTLGRLMVLQRVKPAEGDPTLAGAKARVERVLDLVDARLGEAPYLAGAEFTAADIMSVFSLTKMRLFVDFELGQRANIHAWLKRIGERPAFQAAMAKADPGLA